MANHVMVLGNLGKTPELRKEGPKASMVFTVFDNDDEPSMRYKFVVFGERAEKLAPRMISGRRLMVTGHQKLSIYGPDKTESISAVLDLIRFLDKLEVDPKDSGSTSQQEPGVD